MDSILTYETVIRPDRCIASDCPRLLYRVDRETRREVMSCDAGVWSGTIDVERFDEVRAAFRDFGGVKITGKLQVTCRPSETSFQDNGV